MTRRPPIDDPAVKARETVYRLLKIRLRSEKEIVSKLAAKGIPPDVIQTTVEYFKKARFLDDAVFTRAWINSRLNKPFGAQRIRFELRQKGVDEAIIRELLAVSEEEELDSVLGLAQRRWKKYKGIDPQKAKRRLFEFLARRGFRPAVIQKALRQLTRTHDDT
ncbi:MAG: regulatory protein RecX [Candidatus Omnitrophota bacterium]|nr:regulatory protein RecX [Candidatus Omnitrophota bacterium]MDZ4242531.1 regulatory protein RecX [Candidatus Omnitrophota bacterium]